MPTMRPIVGIFVSKCLSVETAGFDDRNEEVPVPDEHRFALFPVIDPVRGQRKDESGNRHDANRDNRIAKH